MNNRMYLGRFANWEDVMRDFSVKAKIPEPEYVYAAYDTDNYEGYATVIYSNDKKDWYIQSGSHCSCHGLEDQWFYSNEDTIAFDDASIEHMYLNNERMLEFSKWWAGLKKK